MKQIKCKITREQVEDVIVKLENALTNALRNNIRKRVFSDLDPYGEEDWNN
jgi:hypothetical protein